MFVSPDGAKFKSYTEVLRHLGLPTEPLLVARADLAQDQSAPAQAAMQLQTPSAATVSIMPHVLPMMLCIHVCLNPS